MKITKISIILIAGMLLSGGVSYAQFGKVKIKKTTSKTVKDLGKKKVEKEVEPKVESKTEATAMKSTNGGKPEYDPENPVYQSYSRVRDGLKFANSTMNSSQWNYQRGHENESVVKDMLKAKDNLDFLKESGEENKGYYKDFMTQYTTLETKRAADMTSFELDEEYDAKLTVYYNWAQGFGSPDKDFDASYAGYNTFVKEFETERTEKYKGDYVQKRVSFVNQYLTEDVYKEIAPLQNETNSIIKDIHTKNAKGEEYYMMNAPYYIKDLEDVLKSVKYMDKYLLEKKDEITALETQINSEKTVLDAYVSSGKYDAHVAKHKQEKLDAVRIGKKATSNSKYENMAIKGVNKGAVGTRAVITNATWKVSKTDWGYPLHKSLPVELIVKSDGKCYLAFGQMRREYEGAGVYGKEYFDYWGIQEEMNCNNVNK